MSEEEDVEIEYDLPKMLDIPPKLLPLITRFNEFTFFVIEGGRGSAKTQSVGRILLFIGEKRKVRIGAGREVQNTIEESVHQLFMDLIGEFGLAWRTTKNRLRHFVSGSTIVYKSLRERGAVNIKGLEGLDIFWAEEAQTVTMDTLRVLIPTLRKKNIKFFFTMNRFTRDDAVIQELVGRPDCLHIKINFDENPHCPLHIKHEAEVMRLKDPREYAHVYLGEPVAGSDDYLFNYDKLYAAFTRLPFGEVFGRQRILSIDFAAQGNDACVATLLERKSNQHWVIADRHVWHEPDAMVSTGKIVALIGQYRPPMPNSNDQLITILDVGGMGHVVWNRLNEVLAGTHIQVHRFDGATTQGVDVVHYANARTEGYWVLKDWFDQGFLCLDEKRDAVIVKQLEKIKMKHRSDGRRALESKPDMKKETGESPDDADSLMMGVYAAVKFLGRSATSQAETNVIVRKSQSARHQQARPGRTRR